MKKSFTLFLLAVCSLLQLMASQDIVSTTPPDVGRPDHLFYMVSGNNYYANALTAPTQTKENFGLFAFYDADGMANSYYIYSYKAKKWLSYDKASAYSNCTGFVKLVATSVEASCFRMTNFSGDYWEIQPLTSAGNPSKYLNWFRGIGADNPLDGDVSLGLWEESGSKDSGSKWAFEEVPFVVYNYTLVLPEGVSVTIDGKSYQNGDVYTAESSLKRADVHVPSQKGKFAVVSINDAAQTVTVAYADVPEQPAVQPYVRAWVYPQQQAEVGEARLTQSGDAFTLSNNVLAASFVKAGGSLWFGGSEAMSLEPGTEPFTVAFGSGTNVPASAMKLVSLEVADLEAKADAVGGAEHYAGKALVARYEYSYEGAKLLIVWKAVLRDGSHYLRTEMELTAEGDLDMYNVVPMIYNVDTKAAGSAPAVVGNTRGAVLMSNQIFAGLENPVAYNTVGEASGTENPWEEASVVTCNLTPDSWTLVEEGKVPGRVTEATSAAYPDVLAYTQSLTVVEGQKVEVTVEYKSGNHRLNFGGADLLDAAGDILASDYHSGYSGSQKLNNVFTFIAPYSGTFSLRVFVEKKTESIDATSTMTVKLFSPKEGAVVNTDVVGIQGLWSRNTTLPDGETWKISSVVGLVAQDGTEADDNIHKTQKRRSFLAYSERERAVPWRPNPCYISWYELNIDRNNSADPTKNMTAAQVEGILKQWKTNFYDRYGLAPNSFVIDDGWDEYGTWTFHSGFPNEMRNMAALAAEMGAGVGAWLGPVGGYGKSGDYRRQYWNDKGGMVLSNPAYYATFKAAAENLVKNQGDFRFFKFDGISDLFTATGPKPGDKGNEDAEGIIRLERFVREELRPDIFFNTTVGTWASPFWYHYTDATWRQEMDYGTIGNNSIDRENWITYRDRLVYQNYVTNSPICPINTLMTHGFILSSYGQVSKNMDYEACRRELRCAFACGSGMVELYNDYPLMNSINQGRLWADLAECIQWQRRNADVLPDAHWVGGNPWNNTTTAVYGWAAWNGEKSTLTLRNGGNAAKNYSFTLREALNIPKNVSGSIVLRKSFGEQDALPGLNEGNAIDIDETLNVTLPGSSVFCFDGISADTEQVKVTAVNVVSETGDATVEVGKTLVLRAELEPQNPTFPAILWSCDDTDVAEVSGGRVVGKKEGQACITAAATDGSEVVGTFVLTVGKNTDPVPDPEDYPTNFDKDASAVRADRALQSVKLISTTNGEQTLTPAQSRPYVDMSSERLTCKAGEELNVSFGYLGTWMHGYVFIDLDGDKQFSFKEGSTDQSDTEVMTFSFYSGDFNNDSAGYNSVGSYITGDARNTLSCPPFAAPAQAGEYRIRFKVDWNSVDPGGQLAADGTCTGANGILANGGGILDATLVVESVDGIQHTIATATAAPCYDLSGRRLRAPAERGAYICDGKKVIR